MFKVAIITTDNTTKKIIKEYGFYTIVDNGFLRRKKPDKNMLVRNILKIRPDYAIALDYNPHESMKIRRQFGVEMVYPLHSCKELEEALGFDYVGYPTINKLRDYSLEWYLTNIPYDKRWILGFGSKDMPILRHFPAGDNAIAVMNAHYGRVPPKWHQEKIGYIEALRLSLEYLSNLYQRVYV